MNIQHKPDKTAEKAKKTKQPPQVQDHQPGVESEMRPRPEYRPKYPGVGKLKDKVAIITGGDSGIGRAVAVAMAREGALIAILYLEETRRREGDRAPGRGGGQPRDPVRGRRRRRDVLLGVGRARLRGVRPHRHPGEQRRRAARGRRSGRTVERAARAHLPHQRVQLLPHDARLPAVHAERREHHQHHLDHRLSGPQDADRLCGDQGRDRGADALAVAGADRQGHPRQRRRARARSGRR